MCGIVGYWNRRGHVDRDVAGSMAVAMRHRGPDNMGVWVDEAVGIALAHRRLAVLDLSSAANQPMHSASGRYVIVYNGEVYNHLEIRTELEKAGLSPAWRGHSDTETLLAAFEAWDAEKVFHASVGMFALALWDRHKGILILARDRLGEKPLYYGMQEDTLFFSSELKALKFHPFFRAEVDRDSLALLLRHNCIPAPYSIYKGMHKLMPGHYVSIPLSSGNGCADLKPVAWWSYNEVAAGGLSSPFVGSDAEAVDALEAKLSEAIRGQMLLADVPVGALLSGGIDSSTVVALMQAQSIRPVRTFTIGIHGSGNEAIHAKTVARHLGTDHTELYVTSDDALAVIPQLPAIYCEPFSDSSQIPTFLVCKLAGSHVKVALSGDGGDEIFCGYNRYLSARRVWYTMNHFPQAMRRTFAALLRMISPRLWDTLFSAVRPLLPSKAQIAMPGYKAHKLAGVLDLEDEYAFYRRLTSHFENPANVLINSREPNTMLTNLDAWPRMDGFEHWMMAMDAQTYMTDDILVKVDRAGMANSIETRVPMLDHRVIELAWRFPLHLKVRGGQGKWLLRQILNRYVPKDLIERPKMGFGIPIDSWLRGTLRDWAEVLLDERRLRQEGFFRVEQVRRLWREHLEDRRDWSYHLWDILMFQAWLENESRKVAA